MMDEGIVEFCGKMEEQAINVLQNEASKPLTIFYRGGQQVIRGSPHFFYPQTSGEGTDSFSLHK